MSDFASKAEQLLDYIPVPGKGPYRASEVVEAAQVYATLALVEQQRIANLIAFELAQETMMFFGRTGDEIRDGLGL
jgi:hypothetical protein